MGGFGTLLQNYDVLGAFWTTVKLAFFSAILSLLIGTVIAVCRVSPVGVLRTFGTVYVTLLRNTPLTMVVFFCALGLLNNLNVSLADPNSATSVLDNNFRWGVIALSAYTGSFVAEALRSGVNTVPQGQAEAARAIGLGFGATLREVILPQAFRGAIAPLGNVLIALTKNTTVVAVIGVPELAYTMRGMIEFNPNLLYFIFLLVAICFVVLTLPTGIFFTWLSRRLVVQR